MSTPSDDLKDFEHLLVKRLLEWQELQYQSRNGGGHNLDIPDVTPPWRTDDARRYLAYQDAISFLLQGEVKELVAEKNSLGYIALVNPFRGIYKVVALIGEWPEEKEKIWLSEWMRFGNKKIDEGKLLKHVYDQEFGKPLIADWSNSDLVSDIPQQLGFEWVGITPLVYGKHFIGMSLFTFSSKEAGLKKRDRLVRLAQMMLVPVFLPSARSMEESSLISLFTSFYRPSINGIVNQLRDKRAQLEEIANSSLLTASSLDDVRNKLINILDGMEHIATSSTNLLTALNPQPLEEGYTPVTPEIIEQVTAKLVKNIVTDYEGQYAGFNPEWVTCEFKDRVSVPLPQPYLEAILFELLLNSIRGVLDLLTHISKTIGSPRDQTGYSKEVLTGYEVERDASPRIRVQLSERSESHNDKTQKITELSVADNGIGMDSYIRDRAIELGFSTRTGGTGLGLTIVRLHAEACKGQMFLTTSEAAGTDRVTVTLRFTSLD